MDAGNLKFNERFDLIFSNAVLHWVKDQKPVIKGMFKILKNGGRVLIQMGGKGNAAAFPLPPIWMRTLPPFFKILNIPLITGF